MSARKKAETLYRNFREREPSRARRVTVSLPKSLTVMGRVDAIDYTTSHGNKTQPYRHTFKPGSKPLLCADPSTGKIFLIGGRYRVTSRGIVDLDAKRRELD